MSNNISAFFSLMILTTMVMLSCGDSEETNAIPPPTSDDLSFTYNVDSENPNLYYFVGQTTADTWYEHWNFGDNTGEEGLEATKVFFKKGTYEVRFKIFTEGGSAFVTETIEIADDFQGPDLIQNGGMDGEDAWTIFEIGGGVEVVFENGEATWSGGGWGNVGIYQQVEIEANKEYTINMDISGGPMSDCWFEIYLGTVEPQVGVDYNNGGILMGLNTWEGCGGEAFAGQLSDLVCVGEGNKFTWTEPGTAFFVIKSGGGNLGDAGVTIDNVAIRSL